MYNVKLCGQPDRPEGPIATLTSNMMCHPTTPIRWSSRRLAAAKGWRSHFLVVTAVRMSRVDLFQLSAGQNHVCGVAGLAGRGLLTTQFLKLIIATARCKRCAGRAAYFLPLPPPRQPSSLPYWESRHVWLTYQGRLAQCFQSGGGIHGQPTGANHLPRIGKMLRGHITTNTSSIVRCICCRVK